MALGPEFEQFNCEKSFPMMRRLFYAIVKSMVSYGCTTASVKSGVPRYTGTLCCICSLNLQPRPEGMVGLQIAFSGQLL